MASNEVFVGANAQVGMSPELDLYFQDAVLSSSTTLTLSSGQQDLIHLVPDLYIGCTVKIGALASFLDVIRTKSASPKAAELLSAGVA